MKNLSLIACVSADRGLGQGNQLLWHIPEDMAFFKKTTTGHPVVMGSKTFASIGKPLPGRENIILSRGEITGDVTVFHDKSELDQYLETLPGEKFIIGGASLYALYLNEAQTLYLTEVKSTKPADVYFPEFDPADFQREVLKTAKLDGIEYEIVKYTRKEPA